MHDFLWFILLVIIIISFFYKDLMRCAYAKIVKEIIIMEMPLLEPFLAIC